VEPSHLQAKQAQLPEPFFIGEVLQSSDQCCIDWLSGTDGAEDYVSTVMRKNVNTSG